MSIEPVTITKAELMEVCIFAIDKQAQVEGVRRVSLDVDVRNLVQELVVQSFLKKIKHVRSFNLIQNSPVGSLLDSSVLSARFCTEAERIAQEYKDTLRSRSALMIFASFNYLGRTFVGFFQLGGRAVFALLPEKKGIQIVRQAFRNFEKACVLPSPVEGFEASIYQGAQPAEYFERFVGVDRPPTAEEALEQIINERNITSSTELLRVVEEMPAAKQAKVRVEMGGTKAEIRLGELSHTVGKLDTTLILLREGTEAQLRIGRSKVQVNPEDLKNISAILRERHLEVD